MKRFIVILLSLILTLGLFTTASYAGDVDNFKEMFSVVNKIEFDITLEQAFELNALITKESPSAVIDAVINKMKNTLYLRLSLEEVYAIRGVLTKASNTEVVIALRTLTTDTIVAFKVKLADFKTEAIKQTGVITAIEDVITAEDG